MSGSAAACPTRALRRALPRYCARACAAGKPAPGIAGGHPRSCPAIAPSLAVGLCSVHFGYASGSDRRPYPFSYDTRIEGGRNAGGDRHALMLDKSTCTLYELYDARYGSRPTAGSGAIWSLRSNKLRPAGCTSADAAGLPILPGLLNYGQVKRAADRHRDQARDPVHRRADQVRLHLAGQARGRQRREPEPAAGGRAVQAQAQLQRGRLLPPDRVLRRRQGRADRDAALRADPRRQRLRLVRQRGRRSRGGQAASSSCSCRSRRVTSRLSTRAA
jgi:hypothetical protein